MAGEARVACCQSQANENHATQAELEFKMLFYAVDLENARQKYILQMISIQMAVLWKTNVFFFFNPV